MRWSVGWWLSPNHEKAASLLLHRRAYCGQRDIGYHASGEASWRTALTLVLFHSHRMIAALTR